MHQYRTGMLPVARQSGGNKGTWGTQRGMYEFNYLPHVGIEVLAPSHHIEYRTHEGNRRQDRSWFFAVLSEVQERQQEDVGRCDATQSCHRR